MVKNRSAGIVLAVVIACALVDAGIIAAHPLHTSYADVVYDERKGELTATVRVFADDFTRHISGPAGGPAGTLTAERRAAAYVAKTFTLMNATGEAVPLTWCGWKPAGNMIAMCVKGTVRGGLAGVRVRNTVLMDLFADQLNIMQGTFGTRRRTLLFSPKEAVKSIV
jgi:hypothetical protein